MDFVRTELCSHGDACTGGAYADTEHMQARAHNAILATRVAFYNRFVI